MRLAYDCRMGKLVIFFGLNAFYKMNLDYMIEDKIRYISRIIREPDINSLN